MNQPLSIAGATLTMEGAGARLKYGWVVNTLVDPADLAKARDWLNANVPAPKPQPTETTK